MAKDHSPIKTPVHVDAPSSSSKNAKPPAKNKSSPIDDSWKNPSALLALLKWAEEAVTNQLVETKASSEESVAHNPYFPYDQELFGHDEDNTPDLQDDWSYLSSLHKGQKCYTVYLLVKFHYCFPLLMIMFWKEDSPCFPRLLVTPITVNFYFSLLTYTVHKYCLFRILPI